MLPDTSKKSRQKTRVVKKTQNPVYNHAMVFDGFRADEVKEACCELTVWDHHKLSNQFLGGLRLGVGTGKRVAGTGSGSIVATSIVPWSKAKALNPKLP